MAWGGDVCSVDRPPYFEPELVQPSFEREVYAYAHPADGNKRCVAFARSLHIASAFWGFVLMALHLGLHWNIIPGMVRKAAGPAESRWKRYVLHIAEAAVAGYGLYAFVKNQFLSYMFLQSHFVFFDFERPTVLFFTEYIAIMGLFVFLAHYISKGVRAVKK